MKKREVLIRNVIYRHFCYPTNSLQGSFKISGFENNCKTNFRKMTEIGTGNVDSEHTLPECKILFQKYSRVISTKPFYSESFFC